MACAFIGAAIDSSLTPPLIIAHATASRTSPPQGHPNTTLLGFRVALSRRAGLAVSFLKAHVVLRLAGPACVPKKFGLTPWPPSGQNLAPKCSQPGFDPKRVCSNRRGKERQLPAEVGHRFKVCIGGVAARKMTASQKRSQSAVQKAPGQDLAQNGRFPRIPDGEFNSRPRGRQMPEICCQTGPGQDLAQNGRFPRIPGGEFNSRPRGRQMPEICFQRAPGQDFAQNGRFPRIPEGEFNSRPRGRQMPEICFQKAPRQDLAQNGRFPRIPEREFNSRPKGRQTPEICFQKAPGQDLAQNGRFPKDPRRGVL